MSGIAEFSGEQLDLAAQLASHPNPIKTVPGPLPLPNVVPQVVLPPVVVPKVVVPPVVVPAGQLPIVKSPISGPVTIVNPVQQPEPSFMESVKKHVHTEWPKFLIVTIVMIILLAGFILLFYILNKKNIGIFKTYVPVPGTSLFYVNALANPLELPPPLTEEQQKRATAAMNNALEAVQKAKTAGPSADLDALFGFSPVSNPTMTTCTGIGLLTDAVDISSTHPCGTTGIVSGVVPNDAGHNPSIQP